MINTLHGIVTGKFFNAVWVIIFITIFIALKIVKILKKKVKIPLCGYI